MQLIVGVRVISYHMSRPERFSLEKPHLKSQRRSFREQLAIRISDRAISFHISPHIETESSISSTFVLMVVFRQFQFHHKLLLKRNSSLEVLVLKLQLRPNHQKNLQAVSQVQVAIQRFQFHHKLLLKRKSNLEISELAFHLHVTHLMCSQAISTDSVLILRLKSPRMLWRKRRVSSVMTPKHFQAISSLPQSVLPFPSPLLRLRQFGRRCSYF
jgi:hypothetical protein